MTLEEIGDALAEFENRISFLENSLPFNGTESAGSDNEISEEKPESEEYHKYYHHNISLSKAQWAKHQQLENKLTFLENKLTEHIGKKKKGYTIK